jgi:hypothetical protein
MSNPAKKQVWALSAALGLICALSAAEERRTVRRDFDSDAVGAVPAFLRFEGSPGLSPEKWRVIPDASPMSRPFVAIQTEVTGDPGHFHFALSTQAGNFSDGFVQVSTKRAAAKGVARGGVVIRYANPENFIAALVDFQTQTVSAISVRGGKAQVLGTAPISTNEPIWRTVRIEASGKALHVFVSGQKAIEAEDASPRTGSAGMISEAPVPVAFDDLEVSLAPSAGTGH